jgi:hypothetical protein
MSTLASGDNYEISIHGRLAICRVVQRTDRSSSEGADSAEQIARHLKSLAKHRDVTGLIFDFRQAPTVFGPRTEAALADAFAAFEQAGRRVVGLVDGRPMQRLQVSRVISQAAPTYGGVHEDVSAAVRAADPETTSLPASVLPPTRSGG